MGIRSKNIFIKRSVRFEEPLQDLQLVEEKTAKLFPLLNKHSGDENESIFYNISYYISNINEN